MAKACYIDPFTKFKFWADITDEDWEMIGLFDEVLRQLFGYNIIIIADYVNLFRRDNSEREKKSKEELQTEIATRLYQANKLSGNLDQAVFDPWCRDFSHSEKSINLLNNHSYWDSTKCSFLRKKRGVLSAVLRRYRDIRDSHKKKNNKANDPS